MEICANLPKIFFDDQVSYYKLRKKKFLVDNRIVFDKPRFLGWEVLTAVFFRCTQLESEVDASEHGFLSDCKTSS